MLDIWPSAFSKVEKECYNTLATAAFLQMFLVWVAVPLKSGLFSGLVGTEFEPVAKLVQLAILGPTTLAYNFLIVRLKDLGMVGLTVQIIFACMFFVLGLMLTVPSLHPDAPLAETTILRSSLGWLVFIGTDVFTATCNPMIWSVAANVVPPTRAKIVYAKVIQLQQFGALLGSTLIVGTMEWFGFSTMLFLSSCICIFAGMQLNRVMKLKPEVEILQVTDALELQLEFESRTATPATSISPSSTTFDNKNTVITKGLGASEDGAVMGANKLRERVAVASVNLKVSNSPSKDRNMNAETGQWEGLRLIVSRRFVFAMFLVSAFPEIGYSVVAFKMKTLAQAQMATSAEFSAFMAMYGTVSHLLALAYASWLTPFVLRRFELDVLVSFRSWYNPSPIL
jgi:hypothetical protein